MVDVLSDPALIGKFYAYATKVVRDATGRKRKTYVDEEDWLLVYEDSGQAILTGEQFYALQERFQRNWSPPQKAISPCRVSLFSADNITTEPSLMPAV